jgi:branched-chain amino acid transport system substrate-binding protein
MMSRHRLRPGLAGLLVLAISALGCGRPAVQELVIGEYGSLTGATATFGQSTKNGVDLALQELVARRGGRIGGLTVRVVVEDDQGGTEQAAATVQKLVAKDRVIAVIGEAASPRSLAAAPICQAAGVPMITPSSTNAKVTEVGDYIFRVCFIDRFQGTVMARFAVQDLRVRNVAILKNVKNDYSVGLAQSFGETFTALGGLIVAEQAYHEGDQDFRPQLTAIRAKKPDAVYIPGYYAEVGRIARQARELGLKVPLLGGDGWESDQLLAVGGKALNGCYYSNHFAVDGPDPRLQDFRRRYRGHSAGDPDALAGLAYDAARVLFHALEKLADNAPDTFRGLSSTRAGSSARRKATGKLRDLIATTTDFPGVTGSITLDENRNAVKPAVVIEIRDGSKVYRTTIRP